MATGGSYLLCSPRFYGVEYVINPWMEGNVGRADPEKAAAQWERLRQELARSADLQARVGHLGHRAEVAEGALSALRSSISWRVTTPLRLASGGLRRVRAHRRRLR